MKIHVNSFVKRQTEDSKYSHYKGTWHELIQLVEGFWSNLRKGYREGVVEVPVPANRFMSGVVKLKPGDRLVGEFTSRREGEAPRKSFGCVGASKLPAKSAIVVLYQSSVLAEDGDNEYEDAWEIVSINASPEVGEVPMKPETFLANHFQLDGGTTTNMSDAEAMATLRELVVWWSDKEMAEVW